MAEPTEADNALAKSIVARWVSPSAIPSELKPWERIAQALAAARADGVKEGLEKAAHWIANAHRRGTYQGQMRKPGGWALMAKEIRELKEQSRG